MQSSASAALDAMHARVPREETGAASLLAAFAAVPDPRRQASIHFPLTAMLALTVTALLANHLSVLAVAQWGAAQSAEVLRALGFASGRAPHQTTLHRLLRQLDPDALAAALTAFFAPTPTPTLAADRTGGARDAGSRPYQGVAIDGKAQRGRLAGQDAPGPTVHTVALCAHADGVVLAQMPVSATRAKTEAELSVAAPLLATLDWPDRVLTGDALYCQRALCQQVLDAGGDYLLTVKPNQPALYAAIQLLFDPPPEDLTVAPPTVQQTARQATKGHGRVEVRSLRASTDLTTYLDWPGLAQVVRVERTWTERAQQHRSVGYAITSLTPTQTPVDELLGLRRGHWIIENRVHYVLDVTFHEDASRIRVGHGPVVFAWLRRAALSLLRRAGHHRIAQTLRYHSVHPDAALALLGISLPARA